MSDTQVRPSELTLRAAQDQVDHWIKTIGVRYFDEMTNLADEPDYKHVLAEMLAGMMMESARTEPRLPRRVAGC